MISEYDGIVTMPNFIGLCLFIAFITAIFFITQTDNINEKEDNYYKKKGQPDPGRGGALGDRRTQNLRADSDRIRRIIDNSNRRKNY